MTARTDWEHDPSDRVEDVRDHDSESLQDREISGYYDRDDGYDHLDAEPGPLTRYADPLADGCF